MNLVFKILALLLGFFSAYMQTISLHHAPLFLKLIGCFVVPITRVVLRTLDHGWRDGIKTSIILWIGAILGCIYGFFLV